MDKNIKPQVIQEIIEIIKKYECTYNEASELLGAAVRALNNLKIGF